jgi:hypothetical protein
MGARSKLNGAYVAGGLILATIAGTITQSFGVFVVVMIISIVADLASGNIRPHQR